MSIHRSCWNEIRDNRDYEINDSGRVFIPSELQETLGSDPDFLDVVF